MIFQNSRKILALLTFGCPGYNSRSNACDSPQRFLWPAEAFRKNLQVCNLLKHMRSYIGLTELLRACTG